jgi:hypothetical protein
MAETIPSHLAGPALPSHAKPSRAMPGRTTPNLACHALPCLVSFRGVERTRRIACTDFPPGLPRLTAPCVNMDCVRLAKRLDGRARAAPIGQTA